VFESLSSRLDDVFARLRGKGRLSPADIDATLREIRLALLEADVNVGVVNTSSESREVDWWGSSNPDLSEWLLPPTSLRQLNHALRGSGEAGARRTLHFSANGGPVISYVSIVDNVTGDPIYYPAQPDS